jgi:hypothetical protein
VKGRVIPKNSISDFYDLWIKKNISSIII